MKSVFNLVGLLTAVSISLIGSGAIAQFDDLVKYVPETANAMILVDATAIFSSPIAKRGDWQSKREQRFVDGMSSIPPNAARLVIASQVDVDVMQQAWKVALVDAESHSDLSTLATRFGGELDKVSSVPALRLPDDSFVVQFSDRLFGAMRPGSRQQVARWVDRYNGSLSPYLQQGVAFEDASSDILMVFDLQNAFAAKGVERGLEKFETVQKSDVDKEELAKLVASVKGVMLGLTFRDAAYGKIKIDFGQDASLLSGMAKPLILDVMGAYGVTIEECADWTAEVKGNQVFLGGRLTEDGLSHLASLIQLPTPALQQHAGPGGQNQQVNVLEVTQEYYGKVERLLKRLKLKKSKWKTFGQLAQWFDNYANLIDRQPTLHVDPEMLQYSSYVSGQLRGASMSIKGVNIQKRVAEVGAANSSQIYGGTLGNVSQNNWQSGGGWYGGGAVGANYGRRMETNAAYGIAARQGPMGALNSSLRNQQQARTAVRTQATAQQGVSYQQVIQNLQTANTQIRRAMTDKYQVQF